MIITKITGGIGNQMFQYAFGYFLSKKNNCDLFLDLSFYENQVLRKFELDKLNLNYQIATSEQIKKVKLENNIFTLFYRKFHTAFNPTYKRRVISHLTNDFLPEYLEVEVPAYIDGYWQSEKYFPLVKEDLRKQFIYKGVLSIEFQNYLNTIVKQDTSVSLHIRRGDYVSDKSANAAHGIVSLDFYQNAVNLINSKFVGATFMVFSDDIDWCKQNLGFIPNVTFVEGTKNNFEDLTLMSNCSHNIIANSSYSWWGAWLNKNSEKIIIAPKKWFSGRKDSVDYLIPETWIKLE